MGQKNYQNYIIMLNLRELSLKTTKENVVKSSKKESVNESLKRILFDGGEKLTRIELISRISLDRLISEHSEEKLQKLTEVEFKKLIQPVSKTVKNGVDTSVSDSNNNSSFSYNDKYSNLEMKVVSGKFQITKK